MVSLRFPYEKNTIPGLVGVATDLWWPRPGALDQAPELATDLGQQGVDHLVDTTWPGVNEWSIQCGAP